MAGRVRREAPTDLARGAAQFGQWRRSRELGSRIPDSLWSLGVELAKRHGISATSKALGVGYYELRKHCARRSKRNLGEDRGDSPSFVELPAVSWSGGECLLEFELASGAKMRVHLKGQPTPDLVALSRAFREEQ